MKIKSLTLYKTELDAQYTNVIDGGRDDSYNLSTLKTDIFDAFFSPYVILQSSQSVLLYLPYTEVPSQ